MHSVAIFPPVRPFRPWYRVSERPPDYFTAPYSKYMTGRAEREPGPLPDRCLKLPVGFPGAVLYAHRLPLAGINPGNPFSQTAQKLVMKSAA